MVKYKDLIGEFAEYKKQDASFSDLTKFIVGNSKLLSIAQKQVARFYEVKKQYPDFYKKLSTDLSTKCEEYTDEEEALIKEIFEKRLIGFFALDMQAQGKDEKDINDQSDIMFLVYFYLDDDNQIDMVNYIIQNYLCSDMPKDIIDNINDTILNINTSEINYQRAIKDGFSDFHIKILKLKKERYTYEHMSRIFEKTGYGRYSSDLIRQYVSIDIMPLCDAVKIKDCLTYFESAYPNVL